MCLYVINEQPTGWDISLGGGGGGLFHLRTLGLGFGGAGVRKGWATLASWC